MIHVVVVHSCALSRSFCNHSSELVYVVDSICRHDKARAEPMPLIFAFLTLTLTHPFAQDSKRKKMV